MTMVTTYTGNFSNITEPMQFITIINNGANNLFVVLMLVALYIVMLLVMLENTGSFKTTFGATSFVFAILAYFGWLIGWINTNTLFIFGTLAIIGVATLIIKEG